MAFKKTYDEIKEMVLHAALDIEMARAIVRKSGLMAGLLGTAADVFLLFWEFYIPLVHGGAVHWPPYSDYFGFSWGGSGESLRRRSSNEVAWPPSGDEFPGSGPYAAYSPSNVPHGMLWFDGEGTLGNRPRPQAHYQHYHLTGYSEGQRPFLGVRLVETPPRPNPNGIGIQNPGVGPSASGFPFVSGRTYYDPFPWPDAPLYFWADLAENNGLSPFLNVVNWGLKGSLSGQRRYVQEVGNPGSVPGPMLLKAWASVDGGATWIAPWYPVENEPYSAWGTWFINLREIYPFGNSSMPVGTPGRVGQSGWIRKELYRDDVLIKFTLETPTTDTWVMFTDIGITTNATSTFS